MSSSTLSPPSSYSNAITYTTGGHEEAASASGSALKTSSNPKTSSSEEHFSPRVRFNLRPMHFQESFSRTTGGSSSSRSELEIMASMQRLRSPSDPLISFSSAIEGTIRTYCHLEQLSFFLRMFHCSLIQATSRLAPTTSATLPLPSTWVAAAAASAVPVPTIPRPQPLLLLIIYQ